MSSLISHGVPTASPGFKNGEFPASSFSAWPPTSSTFEEPSFCFSGEDRIMYPLGRRVCGTVRQRFNPYQGTLRCIYEPFYEPYGASSSGVKTLFYLEGSDSNSYFKLYVSAGVIYFENKGIGAAGASVIRQAYYTIPVSFAIGDKLHIVCTWDFYARTVDSNYLEIHVDGPADSTPPTGTVTTPG